MNRLSLLPLAALFVALGCGPLDSDLKNACNGPNDCVGDFACVDRVCVAGDKDQSDTDGDGLTDLEELAGWTVIVDDQGFGLAADASFLTRREVDSDPLRADTDGDGLDDNAEFIERSDPRRADTDGDGLEDLEEKVRWRSNLLSVDSDGDARDDAGESIPLAALFDGAELEAGTSPTLADTDGDGRDDREERDAANRDPRVAEIPQVEISVVGELTVQMNVEYTDAETTTVTYGDTYSTTEASRAARTDMESTAVTIAASSGGEGFFDDLELSKEGAIKFFGGKALELGRSAACQARTSDQVEFDQDDPSLLEAAAGAVEGLVGDIFNATGLADGELCEPPSPETTNTTSTTLTRESSRSATQSYSEYRSDSQTRTETASTGTVSVGIRIRNTGVSTFELVNPSITMMQWAASPNPDAAVGQGAFRTLATLAPIDGGVLDANGNRTFTLAPDDEPVIVQVENRAVNADFIKGFLARPQAVFFSPANFVLNDQSGVSFDFLVEETFARTATLVIDDGVSAAQRFQIATNVERDAEGELLGARMGTVLSEVLDIPFTTRAVERSDAEGNAVLVEELESIGNLANQRAADRGDPAAGVPGDSEGLWVIYVKRAAQAEATQPFEEIRVLPGDEVRLVYVRDIDGDGMMAREELVFGTSDGDADTDDDGLTDFEEAKVGWPVTIVYGGGASSVTYRVTADPGAADSDGDGATDLEERELGTDPNNPDTDDDGRADPCEIAPLDTDSAETNGACDPEPVVAYLTNDNTGTNLRVLELNVEGGLNDLGAFTTGLGNATEVVFTPDGAHAYIGSGNNGGRGVHAFDLDPVDYTPTLNPFPQFEVSSGLKRWDAMAIHPSGALVFAADAESDGDRVVAFAVNTTDQPGRLIQVDSNTDVSDVTRLEMDPLGRYLVASNNNRQLGLFDLEAAGLTGDLGAPVETTLTQFINDIAFSADGSTLYVLTSAGLEAYLIDRNTAALTPVDGSPFAFAAGTTLAVDPQGRFLYEGRGDTIYLHTINPTGTVALIDIDNDDLNGVTGFAAGANDLAFSGTGDLLYATGDASTHSFTVGEDGVLAEVASLPVGADRVAVFSRVP